MNNLADIVVADPPWRFSSNSVAKPGRNAMRHYSCMRDDEIAALDVPAKPDALLFMWTTAPMLARSLPVVDAWGFKYVSQIVWVKSRIIMGFWVRSQHEIVLVCRRGTGVPRPIKYDAKGNPCLDKNGRVIRLAPFKTSIITAPQREHSRKPEALQDRIDEVWPDAAKLEMFARRARPGWTVWGNQTDKFERVAVK